MGHAHKVPDAEQEDATYRKWFRIDETGDATVVKKFDDVESVELRVSPDRKRVACLTRTGGESGDVTLVVSDADGSNEKKIVTLKGDGERTRLLGWHGPK